jgi:hypothetical protein
VIGLSLRNVDNCAHPDTVSYLPHYRRVVRAARAATPAPIVVGGSAFTTMPAHYLDALEAPYGVVGEGEVAFVALRRAFEARGDGADLPGVATRLAPGRLRVNPPAWLPSLDTLAASRHWIDNRRYFERGGMGNLQTKRGCHFKCTFCAYPVIEGQGMRTRDPALVAAEAERLLDEHGIDQFFIVDSIFNAPRGYAERVAAALRPLGRRIRWSCFVGPGNFTAELADLMLDAGCQSVDFGTDAGAATTLPRLQASTSTTSWPLRRMPRARPALLPQPRLRQGRNVGHGRGTIGRWTHPADRGDGDVRRARLSRRRCRRSSRAATSRRRALYEPLSLRAAVRQGGRVVAAAARERGNWLPPARRSTTRSSFGRLRGAASGNMWRYVTAPHGRRARGPLVRQRMLAARSIVSSSACGSVFRMTATASGICASVAVKTTTGMLAHSFRSSCFFRKRRPSRRGISRSRTITEAQPPPSRYSQPSWPSRAQTTR